MAVGTGARHRPAPSVLALRALGLGDLLTAVPALRALRAGHPGSRLTLAMPRRYAGLAGLIGGIDSVSPTPGLVPPPWSGPPPDLVVNLHGSGPQSIDVLEGLRPRRIWTHAHPDHPGLDGPPWRSETHEVNRWCRLLEHYGLPTDPRDLRLAPAPLPSARPGCAIVHPGAAHPARRWPEERFAQVARWLANRGEDVVVTGDEAERPLAERVARLARLGGERILCGRTDLLRLAALVAEASLVVCGDTGVAHLATAYSTPSVVLFGPVSPARWGPPGDRGRHVALWAGRVGNPFGQRTDPGLLAISTAMVTAAAERLLGGPEVARAGPGHSTRKGGRA